MAQVALQQQQPWQRDGLLLGEKLASIEGLSADLFASCIALCRPKAAASLTDGELGIQLVEQILAPMYPPRQQDIQELTAICLQVRSNQHFETLQAAFRSCPLMRGALDHAACQQAASTLAKTCQEVYR